MRATTRQHPLAQRRTLCEAKRADLRADPLPRTLSLRQRRPRTPTPPVMRPPPRLCRPMRAAAAWGGSVLRVAVAPRELRASRPKTAVAPPTRRRYAASPCFQLRATPTPHPRQAVQTHGPVADTRRPLLPACIGRPCCSVSRPKRRLTGHGPLRRAGSPPYPPPRNACGSPPPAYLIRPPTPTGVRPPSRSRPRGVARGEKGRRNQRDRAPSFVVPLAHRTW